MTLQGVAMPEYRAESVPSFVPFQLIDWVTMIEIESRPPVELPMIMIQKKQRDCEHSENEGYD